MCNRGVAGMLRAVLRHLLAWLIYGIVHSEGSEGVQLAESVLEEEKEWVGGLGRPSESCERVVINGSLTNNWRRKHAETIIKLKLVSSLP